MAETPILDPKDYEYCWSNFEFKQIVTSTRDYGLFHDADVALFYDHEAKELRFFLSLAEHERISAATLEMLEHGYDQWRQEFLTLQKECERLAEETETHADEVPSMPIEEVIRHYFARVDAFAPFLCTYWYYTNFFSVEAAEKLVSRDPARYADIQVRLDDLGRIKYDGRAALNPYLGYVAFQPYVKALAAHYGRDDIEWLSVDDVRRLVRGMKVPRSTLETTNWLYAKRFDWKPCSGPEVEATVQAFNYHFFRTDMKMIKGTIASKGTYRGTARVLKVVYNDSLKSEIARVQNGDVLVANTTGPEIMSACQRAGAIVTDEGGLTSHAAVVSRELKIPCIVGTKVGSKIIQDGDMIEVDANEGFVRILERSS